jgi:integrase
MNCSPVARNGNYSVTVTVTLDGVKRTLMKSLRTDNEQAAQRKQAEVNDIMTDVETGKKALPTGVAPGDDVFWKWLLEWKGEEKKVEAARNDRTLDHLLTEFTEARATSSLANSSKMLDEIYARHLRRFMVETGKQLVRATDADTDFWKAYKAFRLQDVEPQTYNKERAWQSTFCTENRKVFKENPLDDVKPEKNDIKVQRFRTAAQIEAELAERSYSPEDAADMWDARILTKEEIGRFLKLAQAKDIGLFPMLVVAACTGARRGEIARLKWTDVDFGSRVLYLMSRKGSREDQSTSRDVHMNDLLLKTLNAQKMKTRNATYVFPSTQGKEYPVNEMTERINVLTAGTEFEQGVGWHCFRHSVASILAAEGKDRREINATLGHVTEDMEKRYRHLMPKQREAAVAALEYKVG